MIRALLRIYRQWQANRAYRAWAAFYRTHAAGLRKRHKSVKPLLQRQTEELHAMLRGVM